MKIRKQIYDLTPDDLRRFPVWEFASDEEAEDSQDEATVRPLEITAALNPTEDTFIIRATFKLADGTTMLGCFTSPTANENSLGKTQPVIITDRGQVVFWCGMFEPKVNELAESYEKLGRNAEKVFPIEVASDVELVGGSIRTVIPGFLVLEDWRTGKTKVVK